MKHILTILILFVTLNFLAGEFVILSITDTHAKLENLRKLTTLIRNEPHHLLVDAGDTLQGSSYALDPVSIPMQISNELKTDIWVAGNHDFEILPFQFQNFKGTILGANWSTPEFTPKPWAIIQHKNLKIAFIGMTEHNLQYRTHHNLNLKSPSEVLPKIIAQLRKEKPNIIILICHDGIYFRNGNLHSLLRQYPEIKLVIGGHSHQQNAGEKIGNAWFCQAGKYAEALSRINIEFDDLTGDVKRISSRLIHPTDTTPSATFSPELESHIQRIKTFNQQIVATLPTPIEVTKSRIYPPSYSTLIGSAMCRATKATCAINGGGRFTLKLDAGPLTNEKLFNLYPFEEQLYTIALTPDELRQIIAEESKLINKNYRSLLTYGITLKTDRYQRITDFQLPTADSNGKIVTAFTAYYLAGSGGTTTFMTQYRSRAVPCNVSMRNAILAQLQARESK